MKTPFRGSAEEGGSSASAPFAMGAWPKAAAHSYGKGATVSLLEYAPRSAFGDTINPTFFSMLHNDEMMPGRGHYFATQLFLLLSGLLACVYRLRMRELIVDRFSLQKQVHRVAWYLVPCYLVLYYLGCFIQQQYAFRGKSARICCVSVDFLSSPVLYLPRYVAINKRKRQVVHQ